MDQHTKEKIVWAIFGVGAMYGLGTFLPLPGLMAGIFVAGAAVVLLSSERARATLWRLVRQPPPKEVPILACVSALVAGTLGAHTALVKLGERSLAAAQATVAANAAAPSKPSPTVSVPAPTPVPSPKVTPPAEQAPAPSAAADAERARKEAQATARELRNLLAEGERMEKMRRSKSTEDLRRCGEAMRALSAKADAISTRADGLPLAFRIAIGTAAGHARTCVTCSREAKESCKLGRKALAELDIAR